VDVNNDTDNDVTIEQPEVVFWVVDVDVVVTWGSLSLSQFATVTLFSFIQDKLILADPMNFWISYIAVPSSGSLLSKKSSKATISL